MEDFWSLLRSWPRPHRGISQHKLPLYFGFQFAHNARRRGKALLGITTMPIDLTVNDRNVLSWPGSDHRHS